MSSTDMELSTFRSPFPENHLAIESDLFFEDTTELLGDLSPATRCAFSGLEKPDTAPTTYPTSEYPSPLYHPHVAELEVEAQLDSCGFPSSRWIDLRTIREHDIPLSPSSPSLRSLSLLSPLPSPSIHPIDLQEAEAEANFSDFREGDYYSDAAVRSPLSPSLRFSSLRPLDAEENEDELRGLDLNLLDFEEGTHSDVELPSPSSPSLRSSSLRSLAAEETQPELATVSSSPFHPLLALPGADVDDTLIPALDWEGTDSSSSSSFSSLLKFDDGPLRSSSPESTFHVELSSLKCAHEGGRPVGTCQCLQELNGLARLRKKYTRAEREARNVEGKMKAQEATTRMVKGGYGWGVGKESEYGDKARFEARKRVKREKERGREVSELVKLGMKKRGVDADTDAHTINGAGESEGAEKKKKPKPGMKSIDQLVSKMMLRRKDNGAYRPLTGWRALGHPTSPLVAHSAVLPDEEDEEEDDVEEVEEMVADVGDSPATVQEMLTPRTEGDDAAIFAVDDEGSPWLTFATMGDGYLEHTSECNNLSRGCPATNCICAAPCPPGLGFI